MYNKLLDWIEDHRKLSIFIIVVVVLIALMFGIRTYNLSKKDNSSNADSSTTEVQGGIDTGTTEATTEEVADTTTEQSYQSSLLNRVEDKKTNMSNNSNEKDEDEITQITPNIDVSVSVFSRSKVPNKNVDGSSCKAYLKSVDLLDFDTYWGTALDINDMKSTTKHLVGVEQDGVDEEIADLQSVGWLISNLSKLGKHDAVKFTNLHTIGSLSDDHLAILCSYDWYSVYGLKDTLVVFEDISGTLDRKDFKAGSIFSATAFVHNIKVKTVNGQNVVCVQYNVFK